MNNSNVNLTSISELRRTLNFLAAACLAGLVAALLIVLSSTSAGDSLVSATNLRKLVTPVFLTSFVGALFVLPVGLFKTMKSWIMMPHEFSAAATLLDRICFPFSALVRPKILADPDTPARAKLLDALKWLGAGAILSLIAVTIGEWQG